MNRTEGQGHKDSKKRGQPGSRGVCLKKGLESPYDLWLLAKFVNGFTNIELFTKIVAN